MDHFANSDHAQYGDESINLLNTIRSAHQIFTLSDLEVHMFSLEMSRGDMWIDTTPPSTWFFVLTKGYVRIRNERLGEVIWNPGDIFVGKYQEPEDSFHEILSDGEVSGVFVKMENSSLLRYFDPEISEQLHDSNVLKDRQDKLVQHIANSMLLYPQDGPSRRLFLAKRAFELVDAVFQLFQESREQNKPSCAAPKLCEVDRIKHARDLILDDLQKQFTAENLAKAVGLSTRKLNDGFRATFGESVHSFMKSHRMEYALNLLQAGSTPVALVAYEVGYNPAYFSSEFRRYFGFSPSQLAMKH